MRPQSCSAAQSVRAAIRRKIFFRGDFSPWDEDTSERWLNVSADYAPLARQIFYVMKPWIVACHDGQQWLVPNRTVGGSRLTARI